MKIGIWGAGSIGMLIAARLLQTDCPVWLVCRSPEQSGSLNREGLRFIDPSGREMRMEVNASSIEDPVPDLDVIFLTVKQTQLKEAAALLGQAPRKVPLLCFQNGMGHREILTDRLPDFPLLFAVTTEGALRLSPDCVKHTGLGRTYIGPWEHEEAKGGLLHELASVFSRTELKVTVEEEMKTRVWKKLITNCCINPLTALLGIQNGRLTELPPAQKAVKQIFQEAVSVAGLEGVEINDDFLQEIAKVCRNTYGNKSSMLQDVEARRETEINYINGAVADMGRRHGIPVPANRLMVHLISALTAR